MFDSEHRRKEQRGLPADSNNTLNVRVALNGCHPGIETARSLSGYYAADGLESPRRLFVKIGCEASERMSQAFILKSSPPEQLLHITIG